MDNTMTMEQRIEHKTKRLEKVRARINNLHDQMERAMDQLEQLGYIGIFQGNNFRLVKAENYDRKQFQ